MNTELYEQSRNAGRELALIDGNRINEILRSVASAVMANADEILEANRKDLSRMSPESPLYDRLKLTEDRLAAIAGDMINVSGLPSPLGRVLIDKTLPNGLRLRRISVPFGVIGVIYEARPNVTFDVFSLCMKAGSACILKGGSDALETNLKAVSIIRSVLSGEGINENIITLLPASHEATAELLHAVGYVDLVIPRGSRRLIDFVRREATVPVIETGAGVCHAYFDRDGDLQKGMAIIENAKTRRVSVCNALDCAIIHSERLSDLPQICEGLAKSGVVIHADGPAMEVLAGRYPQELLREATEESFGTEYMSYAMAIKTVCSTDEAIRHILKFGSGHSECIITENEKTASRFLMMVDAACVYHNAPTSFTDGAQFGLGAEIGISTQKLHARGPMALEEITTYKWIIQGDGQIRPR